MTYPPQGPQGPYGQQPDPYGQQPQQPYGGYQQQPSGQWGGYDPNAQYAGGYQQYPGMGGPQPPKSNKGPIIAIVAVVVLLLGGLGITGFVAPGFFLSDDKADSADSGDKTSDSGDKGAGADAFIKDLVAAADDQDKNTLREAACSDATKAVDGAITNIDETSGAKLKDTEENSDTEVVANLLITVDGDEDEYDALVKKDGSDWCWSDIRPDSGSVDESESSDESTSEETSTAGGGGGDSEGEAAIEDFLDKMNAGDASGAGAMVCSDSTYGSVITETAGQNPDLKVDPSTVDVSDISVSADLTGTLNGADAIGTMSVFIENDEWCVYTFFAG